MSSNVHTYILSILERFGLPTTTNCSAQMLFDSALSDKKRFGSTVNLIVPQRIGNCIIHTVPVSELIHFIKAGL